MLSKLKRYAPLQILSASSLFAVIAIHTRFLSISDYGLLALIVSSVEFCVICLVQWVITTFQRFYNSYDEKSILLGKVVVYLTCMSVLGVVVLVFFYFFTDFHSFYILFLAIFLFILRAVYSFFLEYLRVIDDIGKYRTGLCAQTILSVIFTIFALSIAPNIYSALIALLVSYSVSVLFFLCTVRLGFKLINPLEQKFLKYGVPILISNILVFTANRSDRFILALFSDATQIGLYAGMSSIAIGLISLLFMVIAQPLYPEMARVSDNKPLLVEKQKKYSFIIFTLSIPLVSLIGVISHDLLVFMLGPNFKNADTDIFYLILASSFLYNCKVHYLDHFLQFSRRTDCILYVSIASVTMLFTLVALFESRLDAYILSLLVLCTGLFSIFATLFGIKITNSKFILPTSILPCVLITISAVLITTALYSYCSVELNNFMNMVVKSATFVLTYTLIAFAVNYGDFRTKLVRN